MTYNMTSIDDNTDLGGFFTNINTAAGGLPAIGFLIVLWIAAFIFSLNRNLDPGESFTATNFFMIIVSGLMYFGELISLEVPIVFAVLLIFGIGYLSFK